MSQIAGAKRYELMDGPAKGVEAIDIKTGSGLEFTVLPGRGMDIAWASYKGVPISYISKTGIVAPEYYESSGCNWLRNFFAGLLTTCGLSNVGPADSDEIPVLGRQDYGLHGRISNTAAKNVCVSEEWEGDDYCISVSGKMREAQLFGENLTLKRQINVIAGENRIRINDTIKNESRIKHPMMLLYHINFGYPLIDEGTVLECQSVSITPNNKHSNTGIKNHNNMQAPKQGAGEMCYFHDLQCDDEQNIYVSLVNKRLDVRVRLKYNKDELPYFTQWKVMDEQDYSVGFEPANCLPLGRQVNKDRGLLEYLEPGEAKKINMEIEIIDHTG